MSTPVIFDCDTGVDDAMAIIYGAAHGAEFVACSVTHGNVPVEVGARNTLTVLDQVGLTQTPVHQGAARPLAQAPRPAEWIHGRDGLGNTNPPPSARSLAGTLAPAELVRLARQHPGELTLVAVGPLTNIALALLLDSSFASLIKQVVVMGGAVGVPGNASPVAEANTLGDPEAAQLVLQAPWDVTWVGLEATETTAIGPEMVARLDQVSTPHGKFLWATMQHYMDIYQQRLGYRTCVLHDPLALALALEPELATYRLVTADVELGGSRTRGQVVADLRPDAPAPSDPMAPGVVRIVDTVDVPAFHERFLASVGA